MLSKNDPDQTIVDHTGEARTATKKTPSLPDQEIPDDPSMEYVATLQRGPGVIKESLDEIDALIDNSIRLASELPSKDPLGVELSEDMREFVRDYERPLESMLPLSRTTDSWGEDISISMIDDDSSRRSRDVERLSTCSGTETGRQPMNGVRRSRSQETPELDTIREVPCPSNTDSASRSQDTVDSRNGVSKSSRSQKELVPPTEHSDQVCRRGTFQKGSGKNARPSDKRLSGVNFKRSVGPKSRATSATFDQSLADTQNPSHCESYHPGKDHFERKNDRYAALDSSGDVGDYDSHDDIGGCGSDEVARDQFVDSEAGDVSNDVRFRYGNSLPKRVSVDDRGRAINAYEPRLATVERQAATSERLLDVVRCLLFSLE
ncbi:unnamed protein product [Phytophthora fragariaefolia]|uniref:Unnamed protein product n=1 Tax=Phytophthora fragariaefolia TaxID=1490495 RepID=A0A9W6TQR6_9STRA|nr:unnamed protein product [Phytophthora fragariaefolia]